MSRRVKLPGASELFRPTGQSTTPAPARRSLNRETPTRDSPTGDWGEEQVDEQAVAPASPPATGRVRHDEKFTVYVTTEELLALEQARLTLRQQGIVADRGKIVRTSIAMALAGLAADAENSELVRHLAGE